MEREMEREMDREMEREMERERYGDGEREREIWREIEKRRGARASRSVGVKAWKSASRRCAGSRGGAACAARRASPPKNIAIVLFITIAHVAVATPEAGCFVRGALCSHLRRGRGPVYTVAPRSDGLRLAAPPKDRRDGAPQAQHLAAADLGTAPRQRGRCCGGAGGGVAGEA